MPEISIEWLGWIATMLLLVGYYLNAKKLITSWFFWFVGNIIMLVYAIMIESYSVAFLSVFLMGMNVYGYFSWKRDE